MFYKLKIFSLRRNILFKRFLLSILFFLLLTTIAVVTAHAASGGKTPSGTIGWVADNVKASFGPLAQLITAGAYIAGFGFFCGSILKFKAHKDNPTQVPVGTPVALLFVAVSLIFLPSLFSVGGKTLFGDNMTPGGISGIETISGSNK